MGMTAVFRVDLATPRSPITRDPSGSCTRESRYGHVSWLSSRGSSADADEPPSLVRSRYEELDLEEIEKAAADDVAPVQQDDKYFGGDSPN